MTFADCQDALGMQSYQISDAQITASSEWSSTHTAIQGRLHFRATATLQGGWSSRRLDANQWLQVDFRSQYTRVTGVATQGRNDYNQWVTRYNLQYAEDGANFRYYKKLGGSVKVKTISFGLFESN